MTITVDEHDEMRSRELNDELTLMRMEHIANMPKDEYFESKRGDTTFWEGWDRDRVIAWEGLKGTLAGFPGAMRELYTAGVANIEARYLGYAGEGGRGRLSEAGRAFTKQAVEDLGPNPFFDWFDKEQEEAFNDMETASMYLRAYGEGDRDGFLKYLSRGVGGGTKLGIGILAWVPSIVYWPALPPTVAIMATLEAQRSLRETGSEEAALGTFFLHAAAMLTLFRYAGKGTRAVNKHWVGGRVGDKPVAKWLPKPLVGRVEGAGVRGVAAPTTEQAAIIGRNILSGKPASATEGAMAWVATEGRRMAMRGERVVRAIPEVGLEVGVKGGIGATLLNMADHISRNHFDASRVEMEWRKHARDLWPTYVNGVEEMGVIMGLGTFHMMVAGRMQSAARIKEISENPRFAESDKFSARMYDMEQGAAAQNRSDLKMLDNASKSPAGRDAVRNRLAELETQRSGGRELDAQQLIMERMLRDVMERYDYAALRPGEGRGSRVRTGRFTDVTPRGSKTQERFYEYEDGSWRAGEHRDYPTNVLPKDRVKGLKEEGIGEGSVRNEQQTSNIPISSKPSGELTDVNVANLFRREDELAFTEAEARAAADRPTAQKLEEQVAAIEKRLPTSPEEFPEAARVPIELTPREMGDAKRRGLEPEAYLRYRIEALRLQAKAPPQELPEVMREIYEGIEARLPEADITIVEQFRDRADGLREAVGRGDDAEVDRMLGEVREELRGSENPLSRELGRIIERELTDVARPLADAPAETAPGPARAKTASEAGRNVMDTFEVAVREYALRKFKETSKRVIHPTEQTMERVRNTTGDIDINTTKFNRKGATKIRDRLESGEATAMEVSTQKLDLIENRLKLRQVSEESMNVREVNARLSEKVDALTEKISRTNDAETQAKYRERVEELVAEMGDNLQNSVTPIEALRAAREIDYHYEIQRLIGQMRENRRKEQLNRQSEEIVEEIHQPKAGLITGRLKKAVKKRKRRQGPRDTVANWAAGANLETIGVRLGGGETSTSNNVFHTRVAEGRNRRIEEERTYTNDRNKMQSEELGMTQQELTWLTDGAGGGRSTKWVKIRVYRGREAGAKTEVIQVKASHLISLVQRLMDPSTSRIVLTGEKAGLWFDSKIRRKMLGIGPFKKVELGRHEAFFVDAKMVKELVYPTVERVESMSRLDFLIWKTAKWQFDRANSHLKQAIKDFHRKAGERDPTHSHWFTRRWLPRSGELTGELDSLFGGPTPFNQKAMVDMGINRKRHVDDERFHNSLIISDGIIEMQNLVRSTYALKHQAESLWRMERTIDKVDDISIKQERGPTFTDTNMRGAAQQLRDRIRRLNEEIMGAEPPKTGWFDRAIRWLLRRGTQGAMMMKPKLGVSQIYSATNHRIFIPNKYMNRANLHSKLNAGNRGWFQGMRARAIRHSTLFWEASQNTGSNVINPGLVGRGGEVWGAKPQPLGGKTGKGPSAEFWFDHVGWVGIRMGDMHGKLRAWIASEMHVKDDLVDVSRGIRVYDHVTKVDLTDQLKPIADRVLDENGKIINIEDAAIMKEVARRAERSVRNTQPMSDPIYSTGLLGLRQRSTLAQSFMMFHGYKDMVINTWIRQKDRMNREFIVAGGEVSERVRQITEERRAARKAGVPWEGPRLVMHERNRKEAAKIFAHTAVNQIVASSNWVLWTSFWAWGTSRALVGIFKGLPDGYDDEDIKERIKNHSIETFKSIITIVPFTTYPIEAAEAGYRILAGKDEWYSGSEIGYVSQAAEDMQRHIKDAFNNYVEYVESGDMGDLLDTMYDVGQAAKHLAGKWLTPVNLMEDIHGTWQKFLHVDEGGTTYIDPDSARFSNEIPDDLPPQDTDYID